MGEGWETARRRDDANDWVEVRLAAPGTVRLLELDTTHFKGNAPGWFRLSSGDVELIPRTRLQPDTRHLFRVRSADAVDRVRVDVYPDGGFARLRVWGQLTTEGREQLGLRWYNRLPAAHLGQILAGETRGVRCGHRRRGPAGMHRRRPARGGPVARPGRVRAFATIPWKPVRASSGDLISREIRVARRARWEGRRSELERPGSGRSCRSLTHERR